MKFKNVAGIFFFSLLVVNVSVIFAQNTDLRPILLSSDDRNSPFKDGETFIAEVEFLGLDRDNQPYYDTTGGLLLLESNFSVSFLWGRFGPFFPNGKFDREKVKKLVELCKDKAARNGYLEAQVSASGEELPDKQMRLIISVDRGPAARVSEIRFVGNKNVPGEELLEAFQKRDELWTIFRYWQYKHYLDDSSRRVMFGKGFLQAEIKTIVPQKTSDGYLVTIEVEEGVRYRIGDIKIDGVKAFSENEILKMIDQKSGEPADGWALKSFFDEKLKRIYADRGYLLYDGAIDPEYIKPPRKGPDGIVNIRATINEGRVYRISKIGFWEIEEKKAAELRRISGLKVNQIYSQSALEAALKNIDDTQEFEPTNIEYSAHLTADEDTGELEIEFVLSKKE